MKRQPANHRCTTVILLVAIVLALSGSVARSDVELAILPESLAVDPGEIFDIELTITVDGSAFNGYDAVIGFDPDFLIFVEQPLEDQEGPLMTDACPERFHEFEISPDGDVLTVHHVLLCAGVSVTGPGVVFLEIPGEVREYTLAAGETMQVDPGHIALFEPTVNYDITTVKGVANVLFSGEGLFLAKMTGPGRIWLQSLPLSNLARKLAKYMPTKG